MNSEELKRYDRQMRLSEFGIEGQQKLKGTSVLVIGAGGLGCPVLLYLAAAGVGTIGVVDYDTVDESNLQRQVLYNTPDIGKNKADTAVEKLQLLNPHVKFQSFAVKLDADNVSPIVELYDIVVDGSDNFPTRYLVNDICVALKKPLVFGSLFKFEGQVSVFNYQGGPDYRSLYPEPPLAGEVPNCNEIGVIGTLPGIIGTYMANEVIKIAAELGETLSGRLLTIDALHNDIRIFNLQPAEINAAPNKTKGRSFEFISLEDLKHWKDANQDFVFIDVREPYEFEEYNIGGINIPLFEFPQRIKEIPVSDKLIFCCTSGYKSRIAATIISKERSSLIYLVNI